VPGGQSAGTVFFACSSCSCSPLFSIRFCFRFLLQSVCGRSAWSLRTVRFSRFTCGGSGGIYGLSAAPGRTVRVALVDCPRHLAGLSAWPVRTVRPSWPDSPPVPGSFAPWFDSSLLSFMLPRVFQGIVPKT
jgi:hypothetical protein